MPVFTYPAVIAGGQSTVDGSSFYYGNAPPVGATWSYSGATQKKFIFESDPNASRFNGDPTNEYIDPDQQVGGVAAQTVKIGGVEYSVIYDFEFAVTDGVNTYYVAVWDVDLNGDGDVEDPGEDGYYLSFDPRYSVPPPDTPLTITRYLNNSNAVGHVTGLGAALACFTPGTLIRTPNGEALVETLRPGMQVSTLDHGAQDIVWVNSRHLDHAALQRWPEALPIRIPAAALGGGMPQRDLIVSPQHRVLISSRAVRRQFGADQALVAAKHLVGVNGIAQFEPEDGVTYVHFMCRDHQVVVSNGAPTETMYAGPQALASLEPGARRELLRLFPELATRAPGTAKPARQFLTGREGRRMAAAHQRHHRPLLELLMSGRNQRS